jgi:uncharacterized protein YcbK (DUF882 family)
MTNSTQRAAEVFLDQELLKQIIADPTPKDEYGNRLLTTPAGPDCVILVNGVHDADVIIEKLITTAQPGSPQMSLGTSNVTITEAEMIVQEPAGIRFANIFRQACLDLGGLPQDNVNVLKTVFVGYTDTGEIETIWNVAPMYFHIIKSKAQISEQGTVYTLSLAPVVNNAAFHPNISTSAGGINIRGSGNLGEAMDTIADAYSEDALKNCKQMFGGVGNKRVASYFIDFDPRISEASDWSITEDKSVRSQGSGQSNSITVGQSVAIEGAIRLAFESCKQYAEQAIAAVPGKSWTYRIVSTIYTTKTSFEVVYRITPTFVVGDHKQISEDKSLQETANVLHYDYIFTGKNTDIETFDMVVDEGFPLFQTVTTNQNLSTSYRSPTLTRDGVSRAKEAAFLTKERDPAKQIPDNACVGVAVMSDTVRTRNSEMDVLITQYKNLISETISVAIAKSAATITVRGNPAWFSMFNVDPKLIYDGEVDVDLHSAIPYIKIHVKMPSSYTKTGASREEIPTFDDFWYEGVWSVIKITSIFADGQYKNELEILAFPMTGVAETTRDDQPVGGEAAGKPQSKKDVPVELEAARDDTVTSEIKKIPGIVPQTSLSGKFLLASVSAETKVTEDFTLGRMLQTSQVKNWQKDNFPESQEHLDNIVSTINYLQQLQQYLGFPVKINSGYRNHHVNAKVKGALTSDHLVGLAADIVCPSFAASDQDAFLEKIISSGIPFTQVIFESLPNKSVWIHVSTNQKRPRSVTRNNGGPKLIPYKKIPK